MCGNGVRCFAKFVSQLENLHGRQRYVHFLVTPTYCVLCLVVWFCVFMAIFHLWNENNQFSKINFLYLDNFENDNELMEVLLPTCSCNL